MGSLFSNLRPGGGQGAQEADSLALAREVVIPPFPLVAGGLDGDVRTGGVLHGNDGLGGRVGHANQYEERDDGPDDLDRGAVMEVRRFVTRILAMLEHRVKHDAKHADKDYQTYPQDHRMLIIRLLRNDRLRLLQIQLIRVGSRHA